jgi:hypothetical protein
VPERPIIVFDVNETLLDLEAIRQVFDRIFNNPAAMRLWFADLITYSEALTLAGVYVPFTDIGAAVLGMLAATRGIAISAADSAELTDRFATMPPHPEVPAALRRLRDHGFRLFTLTDNTLAISGPWWSCPLHSAEDAEDLALGDRERDVIDRDQRSVRLAEMLDLHRLPARCLVQLTRGGRAVGCFGSEQGVHDDPLG